MFVIEFIVSCENLHFKRRELCDVIIHMGKSLYCFLCFMGKLFPNSVAGRVNKCINFKADTQFPAHNLFT